jgi:hypothetical protein
MKSSARMITAHFEFGRFGEFSTEYFSQQWNLQYYCRQWKSFEQVETVSVRLLQDVGTLKSVEAIVSCT